jgi:hypothetical protein
MLMIPQLALIKNKHPEVYLALKQIIDGVNHGFNQLAIDPNPQVQNLAQPTAPGQIRIYPAPAVPSGVVITAGKGSFTYAIAPNSGHGPTVQYTLITATDSGFTQNVTMYPVGRGLVGTVNVGSGVTLYHKVYAQLPNSQASPAIPAVGSTTTT